MTDCPLQAHGRGRRAGYPALPDGMNGPEIARKAHQLTSSPKVIYMSGYTGDILRRHDDLVYGSILIPKPFDPGDMARQIRQVLDGTAPQTL